jgi:hypothetical protein
MERRHRRCLGMLALHRPAPHGARTQINDLLGVPIQLDVHPAGSFPPRSNLLSSRERELRGSSIGQGGPNVRVPFTHVLTTRGADRIATSSQVCGRGSEKDKVDPKEEPFHPFRTPSSLMKTKFRVAVLSTLRYSPFSLNFAADPGGLHFITAGSETLLAELVAGALAGTKDIVSK